MGGNPAKRGNAIAQASLEESRRQYREQQAEKDRQKSAAKANAVGVRKSGTMAYGNNYQASTDLSSGSGSNYSLLETNYGTASIVGTAMDDAHAKLGG